MARVSEVLEQAPHRFEFYQAVRLLDELAGNVGDAARDSGRQGRLRFSAHPGTAFPPSDIAGLSQGSRATRLLLSFMGLVGSASPLPPYVAQDALSEEHGGAALRAFLDIFNSRLYELLYEAWHARRAGTSGSTAMRIMEALAGVCHGACEASYQARRAAYTGVLAGCPRSAEGLRVMLSGWLEGVPVRVRQRVDRWTTVERPVRLGQYGELGHTAVLGGRYRDTDGLFSVESGPLDREHFVALLPGTPLRREVEDVVRSFVSRPLEFRLELLLAPAEMKPARLGDHEARLGRNAVLAQVATGPLTR